LKYMPKITEIMNLATLLSTDQCMNSYIIVPIKRAEHAFAAETNFKRKLDMQFRYEPAIKKRVDEILDPISVGEV
jgi:hypothetical protein